MLGFYRNWTCIQQQSKCRILNCLGESHENHLCKLNATTSSLLDIDHQHINNTFCVQILPKISHLLWLLQGIDSNEDYNWRHLSDKFKNAANLPPSSIEPPLLSLFQPNSALNCYEVNATGANVLAPETMRTTNPMVVSHQSTLFISFLHSIIYLVLIILVAVLTSRKWK